MASFDQTLKAAQDTLGLPFIVEELTYIDAEFVAVLRKLDETAVFYF